MNFNNFINGKGVRVSPRSYQENAILPIANAKASSA